MLFPDHSLASGQLQCNGENQNDMSVGSHDEMSWDDDLQLAGDEARSVLHVQTNQGDRQQDGVDTSFNISSEPDSPLDLHPSGPYQEEASALVSLPSKPNNYEVSDGRANNPLSDKEWEAAFLLMLHAKFFLPFEGLTFVSSALREYHERVMKVFKLSTGLIDEQSKVDQYLYIYIGQQHHVARSQSSRNVSPTSQLLFNRGIRRISHQEPNGDDLDQIFPDCETHCHPVE